ncbi:MAG: lipopolysaccharide biosynthesis protein [Ornithinimicrobium sp.]
MSPRTPEFPSASTNSNSPLAGTRATRLWDTPAFMGVGRFTAMALGLLGTPFIARALGPEGRGLSAAILAVVIIAPMVVGIGVPLTSRRRAASGRALDAARTGRRWAAITVLPLAVLAWPLEHALFAGMATPERWAFYTSLASVPLTVSWLVDSNILVATRQYRRVGLIAIIQAGVSTGAVLVLWSLNELDVPSVLYANVSGHAVTFVLGRLWVSGRGGSTRDLSDHVREGSTVAGGEIADVSSRKIDQMLALPIIGGANAGIYAVAVTAGSVALPMVQALGNAAFANLTHGDRRVTMHAVRHALALSMMCAALTAAAAWVGIPVIFGAEFRDARVPAMILVGGSVIVGGTFMTTMALVAQRRGSAMTLARVVGLTVAVALLYPLGQWADAAGLALAMVLGSCVSGAMSLALLRLSPWEVAPRPRDFANSVRHLAGRASND